MSGSRSAVRGRAALAGRLVLGLALALLAGSAAPASAAAPEEAAGLAATVAEGWAVNQLPGGAFLNPSQAELAEGKGSFAPPMLMYGLLGGHARSGRSALRAAADRAWPIAVSPARASAFDMLGAGMAYRQYELDEDVREVVADYLRLYTVPALGGRCVVRPSCYHNLKLADALAVLVMTGSGLQSAYPGARLQDPALSRRQAAFTVNSLVPRVIDGRLRARVGGESLRGGLLSDPAGGNPLAYHALSAYMLAEAVQELGAEASLAAQRSLGEALDALTVLMSPDGDLSYSGRGQGQVWVPALAAAAAAHGARIYAQTDPIRSARHLAVAERALVRLRALHLRPDGLLAVVPGNRLTTAGVDWYAHTVAYNGLALYGINRAADLLVPMTGAIPGPLPADHQLTVADREAGKLGISARANTWLAIRAGAMRRHDMRYDFGLLALKVRRDGIWSDIVGPRPLTSTPYLHSGPALVRKGAPMRPEGHEVRVGADGMVEARLRQRTASRRIVRRLRFYARPVNGGARFMLRGASRGDHYRLSFPVPAGTGSWTERRIRASGAVIRIENLLAVRRRTGFHSAPVENLDMIEASAGVRRGGTLRWTIGVR